MPCHWPIGHRNSYEIPLVTVYLDSTEVSKYLPDAIGALNSVWCIVRILTHQKGVICETLMQNISGIVKAIIVSRYMPMYMALLEGISVDTIAHTDLEKQ